MSVLEVHPSKAELLAYFKRRAFVFVPNICNARCDFCYVTPSFGRSSSVPDSVFDRLTRFVSALANIGFDEIRLTGGEPLIFDRIWELISYVKSVGMSYTLLTNGVELAKCIDSLMVNPPSKVTVSMHDIGNAARVFGIEKYDSSEILRSLMDLADHGDVAVAVTVVCLPEIVDSLSNTLCELAKVGVQEVKLVTANNYSDRSLALQSSVKASAIASDWRPLFRSIRSTDLNNRRCLLSSDGSLSIALPSMSIWECCAKVGDSDSYQLADYSDAAMYSMLTRLFQKRSVFTSGFPCTTNLECCPISLTNE